MPLLLGLGSLASFAGQRDEPVLLGVRLNGVDRGASLFLSVDQREIWAPLETLLQWRIRVPALVPRLYQGVAYQSLDLIPGISYVFDSSRQELNIQAQTQAFEGARIGGVPGVLSRPMPSRPGVFLNYDLLGSNVSGVTPSNDRLDGAFEAGFFSGRSVLTSTGLGKDLTSRGQFIRLDSTWTWDRPESLSSWRLGDSLSRAGAWGRPARFAGLQWATNFATQPGYVTFPLPGLRGEAGLPSTVDVYVNNVLQLRRDVPAGPFEILNVPLVTGQGEVQMVVRDFLGRESVVTQSYYVSPRLLRKDMKDFSFEAGFIRQQYAFQSGAYADGFLSGTWRQGITDHWSPEIHAEFLQKYQNAGMTHSVMVPFLGILSASVAGSMDEYARTGSLYSLRYERQGRRLGFGIQGTYTTQDFRQLGDFSGLGQIRRSISGNVGFSPRGSDSLVLGYVDQDYRDSARSQFATASYSLPFFSQIFASLYANRSLNDVGETLVGLNLTRALGPRTSASAFATHQSRNRLSSIQVQKNLEDAPGLGYRVLAQGGTTDRGEAGVYAQSAVGSYSAEIAAVRGQDRGPSYRLGTSGGFAVIEGRAYAARRLSESFGIAQVADYPDVMVYAERRPIGRTNQEGMLFLPRLRPYDINRLSINQADLPIDARVNALELEVIPYQRSGLLAAFPVRRSRGALVLIQDERGDEMPAGAIALVNGESEEFPIGLRGSAFLTGLLPENRVRVITDEGSCEFTFKLPKETLPELGPYVCKGSS